MPRLLSLLEFLQTGSLGPVNLQCTSLEIAKHLGRLLDSDEDELLYWLYGEHLKILFHAAPLEQMEFFKIDYAAQLSGDRFAIGPQFDVSLDGFRGDMTASDFLRWLLDAGIECHIEYEIYKYDTDRIGLLNFEIYISEHVRVMYGGTSGYGLSDVLGKACQGRCFLDFKNDDHHQLLAQIDGLHDIIRMTAIPAAHNVPATPGSIKLAARDYLVLVDEKSCATNKLAPHQR